MIYKEYDKSSIINDWVRENEWHKSKDWTYHEDKLAEYEYLKELVEQTTREQEKKSNPYTTKTIISSIFDDDGDNNPIEREEVEADEEVGPLLAEIFNSDI